MRPYLFFTCSALLALACTAAPAQTFKDSTLEALLLAGRFDELQRVAGPRVAAAPDDAQAVMALALAALQRDDAAPRQAVIQRAEACIDKQPKAAPCHYALGVVLGVQAMSEGLMKAARSAGTVRQALTTAHELDTAWYPARGALTEFYLLAPGMMGGSTAKAAELARTAPKPEQARVLEARVAMQDRKFDVALVAFMALPPAPEAAVAADARSWAVQAALGLVNDGQPAKGQQLAERVLRDHPGDAGATYTLARVKAEAGAHEEAIKLLEQAATQRGAGGWPIGYRIGIAQQALGRTDAAKASFTRFIAAGKGPKQALQDAKKRLEQLGA